MNRSSVFQVLILTCLIFPSLDNASAEEKLISYKSMSVDLALKAATAAMKSCREQGYQVSVAVIERGGTTQVILRDDLAGVLTPDVAIRKAMTALNFKTNTTNLVEPTSNGQPASGLRELPGAIFVGGGVRIEAGGVTVGAMGISGAPNPDVDDTCALAGIASITDILDF